MGLFIRTPWKKAPPSQPGQKLGSQAGQALPLSSLAFAPSYRTALNPPCPLSLSCLDTFCSLCLGLVTIHLVFSLVTAHFAQFVLGVTSSPGSPGTVQAPQGLVSFLAQPPRISTCPSMWL